jgi:hypothetical protein
MEHRVRVPQRCADIDAAFLNQALSPGLRGGAPIADVGVEVIGEGVGFLGEVARLSLRYDDAPAGAVTSMIAKLPTSNEGFKSVGLALGLYEKESGFYRHVADRVSLSVPAAYLNHADHDAGEYLLLMEDMSPLCPGNQLAGCPLAQAEEVLREIAGFHATWWAHPELESFADWLPSVGSAYLDTVRNAYMNAIPKLRPNFGFFLSEYVMAAAERVADLYDEAGDVSSFRHPHTFIHGDFRLDNMMFSADGEVTLLDWQLPCKANAMWDVAYFLAGNFEPEWRREHQDHLVRLYHDALVANGVTDYPFEQCWEDYRANGLVLLSYLVVPAADVDLATLNQRGMELLVQMYSRYAVFIEDMGSVEFLP